MGAPSSAALPGLNLQVNTAGAWRFGYDLPAAVRRFPFLVVADAGKPDVLTLAVTLVQPHLAVPL